MNMTNFKSSRRAFLGTLAFGASAASALTARGAFAEELTRTPTTNEGPFYPTKLPLDTDNDLLIINDAITPAVGTVTHLAGKILGPTGSPLANTLVEIWQCDAHGVYLHPGSDNGSNRDKNFQGFGRFMTGSN